MKARVCVSTAEVAGRPETEVTKMFLIAVASLIGVIGTLLWYTNWAEARVLNADPKAPTDSR